VDVEREDTHDVHALSPLHRDVDMCHMVECTSTYSNSKLDIYTANGGILRTKFVKLCHVAIIPELKLIS
jgi:hypothetical protein